MRVLGRLDLFGLAAGGFLGAVLDLFFTAFVTDAPPVPRDARKQAQDFAARIAAQARGQGIDLAELARALAKLAERPL